ncbi:ThiF family adenylyltransferase [Vibrio parahaemolyticus]|nr:ThiF family adenylyltransferase [Vibrio parahaemolyticus]
MVNEIYRLKASIALVYNDKVLDIFLSNKREQFKITIDYEQIVELLFSFDGEKTVNDILGIYKNIDSNDLFDLISFFLKKNVLIKVDCDYSEMLMSEQYRLINFIEDYCSSTSEVISSLKLISTSKVMIIGIGAVGTWVSESLIRTGLKNITLVDDDTVEISNLHRQGMFFSDDVGKLKVDVLSENLCSIFSDIKVTKIKEKLTSNFFYKYNDKYDLIINCADKPSVDETTRIIARFCMEHKIPHIVGGGYNLHLTLIGQTVIPNKTACVMCFEKHLQKINSADLDGVKKLTRKNRKIGSFSPLSTVAASLASIDAIKIVSGKYDCISNSNSRIEFDVRERDINKHFVEKNDDCEWCGNHGLYN